MEKEEKFQILMEGQKEGVSKTCQHHGISRTLYYRWLKRFQSQGVEGLEKQKKQFVPVNKTGPGIETALLNLVKKHPAFGPRELQYRLEDLGYSISESAVYNILRRNHLSTRKKRLVYAKKRRKPQPGNSHVLKNHIPFKDLSSGECWLAWITFYGEFEGIGRVYEYTLFDYKSKIACTRLYNKVSPEHFKNLLEALALPVAQSLNMDVKYLCFFEETEEIEKASGSFFTEVYSLIRNHGFAIDLHLLKQGESLPDIRGLREHYTGQCLSSLMPYIKRETSFKGLKIFLQDYVRKYNLSHQQEYDSGNYSPVEYHVQATDSKMILPLWAYMDRLY